MQKIAAYLLERRDGMESVEARAAEAGALREAVATWLKSKGAIGLATIGASTGTYDAEDGSHATFRTEEASDSTRSWWFVRLEETQASGRRFLAYLSITTADDRVAVYVTLEVGSDASAVKPVDFDPRCPRIVRTFLERPGAWYHGASRLELPREVSAPTDADELAKAILDPARTIPLVIVTSDAEGHALPNLADRLGYDLAGVANVLSIDDNATWALTGKLGKALSCYRGAVRIYWPKLSVDEDPYRHPLWTAQRLRSMSADPKETRERFRHQLRARIMRASALSVVRPLEIDLIRTAAARRSFALLKERATSLQGAKDLADAFEEANVELEGKLKEQRRLVDELQFRIAELEEDRGALLTRVENAEAISSYQQGTDVVIVPDEPAPQPEEQDAPKDGEERFYKKVGATPTHDKLTRISECGHNSWQNSHGADKARKGLAKLEGRDDWKSLHHCGTCTGGGVWRARW